MFNVCAQCGAYRADKIIVSEGQQSLAVCPACGYRQPFRRLPLYVVGGASGSGKSAVCLALAGRLEEAVALESDVLWSEAFARPGAYAEYYELWLRLCKNVSQAGRPVMLFGAGLGVPENIEARVERRYFSRVHYLALTCDDAVLEARLRARPAWRDSAGDEWIRQQVAFNHWFGEQGVHGQPPVDIVDTTHASLEDVCQAVAGWLRCKC